jgi:hypothetical protein
VTILTYLDANILAKPFTRTLLMVGAAQTESPYKVTWSAAAESEGQRHLRPHTTPLATLRQRYNMPLAPTASNSQRFLGTDPKDRQIIADAACANASVIVTENLRDFGIDDLISANLSAIHYDLFLSHHLSAQAYLDALTILAFSRTTPDKIHAAAGRLHPLTFAVHRNLFPRTSPDPSEHNTPTEMIRGLPQITQGQLPSARNG